MIRCHLVKAENACTRRDRPTRRCDRRNSRSGGWRGRHAPERCEARLAAARAGALRGVAHALLGIVRIAPLAREERHARLDLGDALAMARERRVERGANPGLALRLERALQSRIEALRHD